MWVQIAMVAYLVADYAWSRLTAETGKKRRPPWSLPRTDEGAPIPIVWGRYRVRAPIPSWIDRSFAIAAVPGDAWNPEIARFYFAQSSHWIIAAGFDQGTNLFHTMWAGELKYGIGPFTNTAPESLNGNGGFEPDFRRLYLSTLYKPNIPFGTPQVLTTRADARNEMSFGDIEFLNGNPAQKIVDDAGPLTYLGKYMTEFTTTAGLRPEQKLYGNLDYTKDIPGFRGVMSVFLFNREAGVNPLLRHFTVGGSPSQPALSFEVSSHRDNSMPAVGIMARIGPDANPANVLYSVLTDPDKGAIPTAYVDMDNFSAVATTLHQESHGFSYAVEEALDIGGMIEMVLKQIDAAIYVDETDSKIKIRLIRGDYNVRDLFHITKDNCDDLINFTMGSYANAVNKVTVVYADRDSDYADRSVSAASLAGTANNNRIREEIIEMRSVTNAALASRIAARELAWSGNPMMKCRALLNRSFATLSIGLPVKVTWSEPDLAGVVFRVAAIDKGTLVNGKIAVDLVADQHFNYRQIPPTVPHYGVPHVNIRAL